MPNTHTITTTSTNVTLHQQQLASQQSPSYQQAYQAATPEEIKYLEGQFYAKYGTILQEIDPQIANQWIFRRNIMATDIVKAFATLIG